MIDLPAALLAAIGQEGQKCYPSEACGILLGHLADDDRRRVTDIMPIDNASDPTEQYHRFRIEAEDLMAAETRGASQGLEVLGFYHSHPDHPARPSDYDLGHALPFYSYVIVTVDQGRAGQITSWRLAPDSYKFDPETLEKI
ncbi:MAG: M67 family metallopeptidase [Candidatus Adiutrix sp.]|jgi:proteasome lid subunit RPN8/RPN11|nr:M67 family metallopeptidase [Candidatus Adiutrix sp.]